jgi:acetyltransferase
MNVKKLHKLFNPKTIAVIGASNAAGHVGYSLMKNLISSGYEGIVYPVNPKHESIQGVKAYPYIRSVPDPVDLAIIATPASTVPDILAECAAVGIRSVVIVSAGFAESGADGVKLAHAVRSAIDTHGMTVLGPNCLGFIRPKIRLNASFARAMANPGGIAFISQSGALCSAVLDWSNAENVGFSYFISTGDMIDIGYHDLIDYLGNDDSTTSILIYMESMKEARKFMSAARNFARAKPIIILKVGKSLEGAKAALSHTGSITGNDQVFDAAFKRAGILRVGSISELFDCAKTLSMQERPAGNRLAIVTNAGGPGVIATDMLIATGGKLATLSPETIQYLDDVLPAQWSHGNPVDVLGDADPMRYRKAVEACLTDQDTDGVLVILTPQAVTETVRVATELAGLAKTRKKTVLCAFMGEGDVAEARKILEQGSVPAYGKPEDAVRAFMHMYQYERNLKSLTETPASVPHAFTPDVSKATGIIQNAYTQNRTILTEPESKQLLRAYQIPVPEGELVHSADDAVRVADRIGYPVVMKVVSPNIVHKIDVGGVAINLTDADAVHKAYETINTSVREKAPAAAIDGLYVEQMIKKRYELLLGSKKDPIFGPVIVFGMGGIAVEVFKDTNIGLPPLNMALSQRMIEGTKIFRLLKGYRGVAGVDVQSIQFLLYKFAYLIMDFPQIRELDINPFVVDEEGEVVLDAKVILDEVQPDTTAKPYSHLVISPYPKEYEKPVVMRDGTHVLLRPIRPEDEPMEAEMFRTFSKETERFRFFGPIGSVTHEMLIRYTQIDYDREIAIIAETEEGGARRMLGVVRLISDPYNQKGEFAIVIGDPWQKKGLGGEMMDVMLRIARERGVRMVYAFLLEDNFTMLHMFESRGFTVSREEGMFRVEQVLA